MAIANAFYIVLFLSAFGGLAWLSVIFIQAVLKQKLPYPLAVVMAFFFLVPILTPGLKLVTPEPTWVEVFLAGAKIWAAGFVFFGCVNILKISLAWLKLQKFPACSDPRVLDLLQACAQNLKMKSTPPILYGDLSEPVCVVSTGRSSIILAEYLVNRLSDEEIQTVLTHELLHIKRYHTAMQRLFDFLCCIHWFNPFVWIARHEFALCCEIDSDKNALAALPGISTPVYARTMLKVMELSLGKKAHAIQTIGALDFLMAKRRLSSILTPQPDYKTAITILLAVAIIFSISFLSLRGSRGYFYPYPAASVGAEWSPDHE